MVPLVVESWIWWGLVILVAGSRFISRRITLGSFLHFQLDDALMLLCWAFYTTLLVTINIVHNTSSNLLPPGFDVASLTPQDISEREFGSKLILVVEQCQCATVWGAKGCLIILYLRLTELRKANLAIKILAAYVAVSYVVMEIFYFAVWCRPFHEYWAVPTDNVQCDAATNHLIMNAVFNLSSDCAMLIVGLPMFLGLHLPWKQKVPLILVFSMGVFVVLAAVLNKVYSFSQPFGDLWTYWYVRESSTALLVANMPFVWTLWRRITKLRSIHGRSQSMRTRNSGSQDSPVSEQRDGWRIETKNAPYTFRIGNCVESLDSLQRSPTTMSLSEFLQSDSSEFDAAQVKSVSRESSGSHKGCHNHGAGASGPTLEPKQSDVMASSSLRSEQSVGSFV